MTRPLTIVLAAGGTGGHVFPAVALAETLKARGHRIIIATDIITPTRLHRWACSWSPPVRW